MQKRLLTLTAMMLLAFMPVAEADEQVTIHPLVERIDQGPLTTDPKGEYIVGFYELPLDKVSYAGFPVLKVDEDLRYFLVHAEARVALDAVTLLDNEVRYVEINNPGDRVLHLTPNDALYSDPGHYGSKKINGEAAWDITTGSTAVKVGMVDSGLVANHEDHQGARYLGGWDFYEGDNNPQDTGGSCSFHGTHTTGTAGANINNGVGIAGMSQHSVLVAKIFHKVGGGPYSCKSAGDTGIADALKYVGDQGGHVSSNSWGGGAFSTAINDAIAYSHGLGVHHVAAAGNGGCSNCIGNPWAPAASIVTIVTGTDSNDNGYTSNSKGPEADVSAPAVGILSSVGNGYSAYSGTSMATPHVAGTVALMKAVDGTLTFSQADQILKDTAVDLGPAGHDNTFGFGRIDAAAAVIAAGGEPPVAQCSDGIDNDGDGLTDFPNDPGCTDANDNDETDPPAPACSDGIDNDGDGFTDFPADSGCTDANDDDETDAASTMHVHSLDHRRQGGPKNGNLLIDVVIYDSNELGVAAANVCVQVDKAGGSSASGCADTAADGTVTFEWSGVGSGTYTTCVTGLSHAVLAWDSAADHASSGSCHTEGV